MLTKLSVRSVGNEFQIVGERRGRMHSCRKQFWPQHSEPDSRLIWPH